MCCELGSGLGWEPARALAATLGSPPSGLLPSAQRNSRATHWYESWAPQRMTGASGVAPSWSCGGVGVGVGVGCEDSGAAGCGDRLAHASGPAATSNPARTDRARQREVGIGTAMVSSLVQGRVSCLCVITDWQCAVLGFREYGVTWCERATPAHAEGIALGRDTDVHYHAWSPKNSGKIPPIGAPRPLASRRGLIC